MTHPISIQIRVVPIPPPIRRHALHHGAILVILQGQEDVKDKTPILVRCTFRSDDHRFDTVDAGLVHPERISCYFPERSAQGVSLPEENGRVPSDRKTRRENSELFGNGQRSLWGALPSQL
jgi:hypothetical protein